MIPSSEDISSLKLIRERISAICNSVVASEDHTTRSLLEVGPSPRFPVVFQNAIHHTMDIVAGDNITYCADICSAKQLSLISHRYDTILLFEVLEHVSNPFQAISNLRTLLKPAGSIHITTPFNFRIHGPLPDNWRFTEHGLRQLLSDGWCSVEITSMETPNRPLMPIHYYSRAVVM
jgi:hypothetical protein